MNWSLYEGDKFLQPLKFSNGKTQEDVVEEVLEAIGKGKKIIFIHGVCGTGKSAIALNIAKELGKTSVIVPVKNLQMQYKKDYEKNKYILKKNQEKLKISVITGRGNHKCKFLEDNEGAIPKIKREVDSTLHDIFSGKKKEVEDLIGNDISAENFKIPCKLEIREKNWNRIKNYLKQNPKIDYRDFLDIKDVKRISLATVCPYWSPVLPEKYSLDKFNKPKRYEYDAIGGKFVFHERKPGCGFYSQFKSYIDSDVMVFNSQKYKFESLIGRKPKTEVEIIDECDDFLDSFANQRSLNLDRLINSLVNVKVEHEEYMKAVFEMIDILRNVKVNQRVRDSVFNGEIILLKETGIYDLFRTMIEVLEMIYEIDEESYVYDLVETIRMFDEYFGETFVTFSKKDENLIANLVTTNLEKRFAEMVEKNKIIVLMSGTLHSESVLKNIFGLQDFEIVEAEVVNQGQINVVKTGLESDCKYANFQNGNHSREDYLKALDKCLEIGRKPALVHVNAFVDLPSADEIKEFDLKNLKSREEVRDVQRDDKEGYLIEEFKAGEQKVLFSTKCSRGVDFPGDQCKTIVFTKYPNPNVQDAFWKILMKTKPNHYWDFYKDKARRELWQKVYRGIRFKEDKVDVLSPDSRVIEVFEKGD